MPQPRPLHSALVYLLAGPLLAGALFACSSEASDGATPLRYPDRTEADREPDLGGGGEGDDEQSASPTLEPATPEEADPEPPGAEAPKTFRGTLESSEPVTFGGKPYCEYTVELRMIELEISALTSGEVLSASLSNLMVERPVAPCTYSGKAPKAQSFTLKTATQNGTLTNLVFEGAASNDPKTELIVELSRTGETIEASAAWRRIDQKPPLDWQVRAELSLAAQ